MLHVSVQFPSGDSTRAKDCGGQGSNRTWREFSHANDTTNVMLQCVFIEHFSLGCDTTSCLQHFTIRYTNM